MSEFDFDRSAETPRNVRVRHSLGFSNGFGFGCGLFAAFLFITSIPIAVFVVLPAIHRVQEASERVRSQPVDPPSEPIQWLKSPVRLGDITVRITDTRVGIVPLDGITGASESTEPFLAVGIEISNRNASRKVDYRPWSDRLSKATLTDTAGNTYRLVHFGFGTDVIGQQRNSTSVYSDQPVEDLLIFERPVRAAHTLHLELPGQHVGTTSPFRIEFPATK